MRDGGGEEQWRLPRLLPPLFVNVLDLITGTLAQRSAKQVVPCYQFIPHNKS